MSTLSPTTPISRFCRTITTIVQSKSRQIRFIIVCLCSFVLFQVSHDMRYSCTLSAREYTTAYFMGSDNAPLTIIQNHSHLCLTILQNIDNEAEAIPGWQLDVISPSALITCLWTIFLPCKWRLKEKSIHQHEGRNVFSRSGTRTMRGKNQ